MPIPPASTEAGAAIRGIALMTAAFGLFACLDTTAKWLGRTMASGDIAFLRYATHVILLALVWRIWSNTECLRTSRPIAQIVRGLFLLSSTFFNFWALQHLQLAEASAIMFAGPLVVTALAGPVLGEKVGIRRWVAVLVGFVGVLIVMRPGTGAMHWAAGLSVCAMCSYVGYALMTRKLHRTESSEALLMISAMVGALGLSPFAVSAVESLQGWQWALAFMMGFFGALGHYALVLAHRMSSASVLAPFVYTQIVWMILFGFIIFGDIPDVWTIVGTSIIVSAGIYILHRERIRGRPVASNIPTKL
ncbi:MAG: DMT family transporter [Pseudomonadota bacterium]